VARRPGHGPAGAAAAAWPAAALAGSDELLMTVIAVPVMTVIAVPGRPDRVNPRNGMI